ncbi:MAG: serine hydrolase, partial [Chloroflexi bacterium]|nr:serine hydrolase [Chloroflexota bacterium]
MKQLRYSIFLLLTYLFVGFSGIPNTKASSMIQNNNVEPPTADSVTTFVDAFVAEKMAAAHAPGLVITVVYQGEVILSKGYGLADVATGRPMTAQTNLRA